jgi:hypothetical protein
VQTEETTVDEFAKYKDDLDEHNFDGETFAIAIYLNINTNNNIDTENMSSILKNLMRKLTD